MAVLSAEARATADLLGLSMSVAGAGNATEALGRLTSYLAGRLDSDQCRCFLLDPGADAGALIICADAFRPEDRGMHLSYEALSPEVRGLLNRSVDWAGDDEGAVATGVVGPPPVLFGPLLHSDAGRGVVVPVICDRRVVGLQWVRFRDPGREIRDWEIALIRCASSLGGQAVGTLWTDRVRLEDERARGEAHRAQLKKVERSNLRLRDALQAQDRMLARYAHDMRAPLGVIGGHIKLLRQRTQLEELQQRSLETIERQVERLRRLVDGLVSTKRLESRTEACDVGPMLRAWMQDLEVLADRAQVSLQAEIPGDLGICRVDVEALHTIVTNLVDNAIKYAAGGWALLSVRRRHDDRLELVVSDSGPGMSGEGLENAFDLFFRGTEEGGPGGHGVGLASVRQAVQRMGGEIELEQTSTGGAQLRVLVPAPLDELATDDTNPTPAQVFQILVVDPDEEELAETARALRKRFSVLSARSDREANWLLQQRPVDCVIIELDPPGMSGLALATALHHDRRRSSLPILFTSHSDLTGVALRQKPGGLKDVLLKPLPSDELCEKVAHAILETRDRERRIEQVSIDPHTGLGGRQHALSEVARLIEVSAAAQRPLSVVMVEIDELEREAGGDDALDPVEVADLVHHVSETLETVTRGEEPVARWDAGRFLCVLPSTSAPAARKLASRLHLRLARFKAGGETVTVRMGIATADPREEIDQETLVLRAEEALAAAAASEGSSLAVWRKKRRPVTAKRPVKRHRLLVVDDDPDVRQTLSTFFAQKGLIVHTAASAEEAIRSASQNPPQLAIIDLSLPDLTGFHLIQHLRKIGDSELPAIAYTGLSDPQLFRDARQAGFNAWLKKGTDLEVLARQVERCLP